MNLPEDLIDNVKLALESGRKIEALLEEVRKQRSELKPERQKVR